MANPGHFRHGYDPRRQRSSVEVVDRFWAKVRKGDGCWEWTAAKGPEGYGAFVYRGHTRRSHRVAWELVNGAIPDGVFVCHRCDNPECVRPDHLFLGTSADNTADARQKGRLGAPRKEACPRGHAYGGENIYLRPSYKGKRPDYRDCRLCRNARSTWYNRRRRGVPVPSHWSDLLAAD